MMDITGFVLLLVMAGVAFYVLFHVVRGAVLSALRQFDQEKSSDSQSTGMVKRPPE